MKRKQPISHELFAKHLTELGFNFSQEFRFDETRKFRADFRVERFAENEAGRYIRPQLKILIDIQGSVWAQGRHSRGAGYTVDCEKANLATMQGWRFLRFTTEDILSGKAKSFLEKWVL
jgi:hypothetical protein